MRKSEGLAYNTLTTCLDDRILTVTLSRPDRLNAFTVEMANALEQLFQSAADDDGIGAIIVTGDGRAFCAGMELGSTGNAFGLDERLSLDAAELVQRQNDPDIVHGVRDTGGRVTLAIHDCRKPVITAIHGAAVGTRSLSCPIRREPMASKSTRQSRRKTHLDRHRGCNRRLEGGAHTLVERASGGLSSTISKGDLVFN